MRAEFCAELANVCRIGRRAHQSGIALKLYSFAGLFSNTALSSAQTAATASAEELFMCKSNKIKQHQKVFKKHRNAHTAQNYTH